MFQIQVDDKTSPRVLQAAIHLLMELQDTSTVLLPHADRPDTGVITPPVPVPPPSPMSWPQQPTAPIQATWGDATAPTPLPPAPSTAAAPAWPTAPGAPPAFSVQGLPVPTSPAPAAAPMAAAPQAAPTRSPAGGVPVDISGLPWDNRIHSSGASKLANGKWKPKKGIANDLAYVGRVEAELRHTMSLPIPPAPAQQAPQPPAPVPQQAPPAPTPLPPVVYAPAPAPVPQQAPPAPAQQAPQPPQNISGPQTFAELTAAVSGALSAGAFTAQRLMEVVTQVGLPSLPMLQNRPELVPLVWAKLTGQVA